MSEIRNLRKPPIIEALIDLQFTGSEIQEPELNSFAKAQREARQGWAMKEVNKMEATFKINEADGSFKKILSGYALENDNITRVIQIKQDGLTVNYAKEYTGWDSIISDTRDIADAYVKATKPKKLVRVAARYINRVLLPANDFSDFSALLTVAPTAPNGLNSGKMYDFAYERVVREIDGGYAARLGISTVEPNPGESTNSLLIDIDVVKDCDANPSFDVANEYLSEIRLIKNQIFFGLLNEKFIREFE